MRVSIVTLVAAAYTAAYTGLATACSQKAAVGTNPSGNPITAPVLQVVEAGKPFDITWNPTTPGTVSIVLLKGPATNVLPIDCLGDNIPNTGKLTWIPATNLEANVTGYGLQIIVTGTGQYQYSTQFGISNDLAPKPSASASAKPISQLSDGQPQVATSSAAIKPISQLSDGQPQVATSAVVKPITQIRDGQIQVPTSVATSRPALTSLTSIVTVKTNSTTSVPISTYSTRASLKFTSRLNSTVVLPSKTLSVPVSLKTTASVRAPSGAASGSQGLTRTPTSTFAVSTGAAGRLLAQGGAVGLLGVFVAALL